MRVVRDLSQLGEIENSIITIGSFDGVHKGHQKIISRLCQLANETGGESYLITFDPHPRSVIYPKDKSLQLLTSIEEKIDLFERFGLDNVVFAPFTVEFSQISPLEYIEKFIVEKFNPKYIVIGYDHRFGINRTGDLALLQNLQNKYNFEVIEIPKQEIDEITISSTKIRNAILDGDLLKANTLLNHSFQLSGQVIKGRKLGTEIGFPTANLQLEDSKKIIPKDGIYACRVKHNGQSYKGMLYIGDIPTIGTDNPKAIEVNIFDFNEDIYNQRISIEILEYLRDDQKFDGLNALKSQLYKDRENALSYFSKIDFKDNALATIAILTYNSKHFLESFLSSVSYSSSKYNIATCIIDNGSQDESIEYVNKWYPEMDTIHFKSNHGFAKGYNLAINQIDSKYTVLLNSDVQVTEDWLDPILDFLESNESYAAAMPKILSYDDKNKFEYAGAGGGFLDFLAYPFCKGRIFDTLEDDNGQYNSNADIFWASGAALVIRTDIYKKLGGLDEDYFAHQEEIDLCWRINKTGFKIAVIPASTIYHVGGGTLNYGDAKKVYLNFRNSLSNIFKNESLFNTIWKIPLRLILDGVAGLKFLFSGEVKSTWAIIKAHFNFYFNIFSIAKRRSYFNRLISKAKQNNKTIGLSNKSVIFQYYVLGKKTYSKIFN